MKKLFLIIGLFFALNSQAQFSASFEHPYSIGGYGLLYNWFCTQPQARVKYGYLYNWFAATDSRNICSVGWHVPLWSDYNTLIGGLGGSSIAGGKLKETGFSHWLDPNTGATNEVNFNAVGAAYRGEFGVFTPIMESCMLWISEEYWYDPTLGLTVNMGYLTTNATLNSGNPKHYGQSIRPIKDSTTLTHGQTGTYTGNDGKVYKTICIGTQEWVSSDLTETKYRDGSAIPEVTDNTAWSGLTTGGRCSYNNVEANAGTTASIAPVGWHVPSKAELQTLQTYLGGAAISGGKLKQIGLTHWNTPNTGADNSSGFNGVGSGSRDAITTGNFGNLKYYCYLWNYDTYNSSSARYSLLEYSSSSLYINSNAYKQYGFSIRLIKDDPSTWNPGDTVTDIDGNIYQTVKIGTQVWTAANWKCTHYRDGTEIPNVTDNTAWAALTTGAWCVYNNQMKYK